MITEDYISFEIAKLLKEKGFDEKCQKVYMHNGQLLLAPIFMEGESFVNNKDIELVANYNDWITYTQGEYAYLCPTLQMAMKWLREVHSLSVEVQFFLNEENGISSWNYDIIDIITYCNKARYAMCVNFETYEEAVEAAIKYVLENLL